MNIGTIRNLFFLLGQQWQHSLEVFIPENLKPFFLVSINAFLKASTSFFLYFWWLLLLPCFLSLNPILVFGFNFNWLLIWRAILWFLIFLSVRPSIDLKTPHYYVSYAPRLFGFGILILLVGIIQGVIFRLDAWLPIPILAWLVERVLFIFHNLVAFILIPSPWLLFGGYFFLDRYASVRTLVDTPLRAFKMLSYTYPFCLISVLVLIPLFFVGDFTIALVTQFLPTTIRCIINNLFITLYHIFIASWFSTIYIKRAHEDFALYFE
jgi:hypothetical protein